MLVNISTALHLTIDTLVLALVVNVVEVAEHLDGREVGLGVIDDTLRSVLDQVFEQGESLDDVSSCPGHQAMRVTGAWICCVEFLVPRITTTTDPCAALAPLTTYLVDLTPFTSLLPARLAWDAVCGLRSADPDSLHEARVDGRHNLIKVLAGG
jgi:hypothetical protein